MVKERTLKLHVIHRLAKAAREHLDNLERAASSHVQMVRTYWRPIIHLTYLQTYYHITGRRMTTAARKASPLVLRLLSLARRRTPEMYEPAQVVVTDGWGEPPAKRHKPNPPLRLRYNADPTRCGVIMWWHVCGFGRRGAPTLLMSVYHL